MASSTPSAYSFTKWLQLKIYQVEVTFSVYIFTPLEKFIFCTFFSFFSFPSLFSPPTPRLLSSMNYNHD